MLAHVRRHPKREPAWLTEAKRLGLTWTGLHQLARGVAGRNIGGGQARKKLIADGYAEEVPVGLEPGMPFTGHYRTEPTEKGRAAIAALRKLGW